MYNHRQAFVVPYITVESIFATASVSLRDIFIMEANEAGKFSGEPSSYRPIHVLDIMVTSRMSNQIHAKELVL